MNNTIESQNYYATSISSFVVSRKISSSRLYQQLEEENDRVSSGISGIGSTDQSIVKDRDYINGVAS